MLSESSVALIARRVASSYASFVDSGLIALRANAAPDVLEDDADVDEELVGVEDEEARGVDGGMDQSVFIAAGLESQTSEGSVPTTLCKTLAAHSADWVSGTSRT